MKSGEFKNLKYEYSEEPTPNLSCVKRYSNKKDHYVLTREDKSKIKKLLSDYNVKKRGTGFPAILCIDKDNNIFMNGCKSKDVSINLLNGELIEVPGASDIELYSIGIDQNGKEFFSHYSSYPRWNLTNINEYDLTEYEAMNSLVYIIKKHAYDDWEFAYDAYVFFGDKLQYIFYNVDHVRLFSSTDIEIKLETRNNPNQRMEFCEYRCINGKWIDIREYEEGFENPDCHIPAPVPYDISKDGMIAIPYFLNGTRNSIVFHEYCKDNAIRLEKANNILDDETENYVAFFNPNDYKSIAFAGYYGVLGYGIFKTELDVIDRVLSGPGYPNSFLRQTWNSNDIMNFRSFMKTVFEELDEPFNTYSRPLKLLDKPSQQGVHMGISNYLQEKEDYKETSYNDVKSIYEEYTNIAYERGALKIKWINEYNLFETIKSLYPDAVFQYHAQWLGLQSLDTFIPSIQTAFEYQGEQHYQPIEFFGGEQGLKERQTRDEKKRILCEKNNVRLIEWKYTEKITKIEVNKKINEIKE